MFLEGPGDDRQRPKLSLAIYRLAGEMMGSLAIYRLAGDKSLALAMKNFRWRPISRCFFYYFF
jgi:hypothetical protein